MLNPNINYVYKMVTTKLSVYCWPITVLFSSSREVPTGVMQSGELVPDTSNVDMKAQKDGKWCSREAAIGPANQ